VSSPKSELLPLASPLAAVQAPPRQLSHQCKGADVLAAAAGPARAAVCSAHCRVPHRWKESIHVAGEGEGSKATLVSWLKRRAEADFGAAVVGCHVWVCWCADAEYYMGEIISYSRENGKHKVWSPVVHAVSVRVRYRQLCRLRQIMYIKCQMICCRSSTQIDLLRSFTCRLRNLTSGQPSQPSALTLQTAASLSWCVL
jgi:hypothetical protein